MTEEMRRSAGPITLAQLADHKALPIDFLQSLGLHDLPGGGVGIRYWDHLGVPQYVKERTALTAKKGSRIPKGKHAIPYGAEPEHLGIARHQGCLFVVEGESDCWALWFHGRPALGIQGAGATCRLEAEHLEGISCIYAVHEPGEGGDAFVSGLAKRLAELRWQGVASEICMPQGIKDPSDLHKAGSDQFDERLDACVDRAEPLPPPPSAVADGHANGNGKPGYLLPLEAHIKDVADSEPDGGWLWQGIFARGSTTLFSALWKAGKTTLLTHLLKAFETGGYFCGLPITPAKVLYVSEEQPRLWVERRNKLHLAGELWLLIRPFRAKPRMHDWLNFLDQLGERVAAKGYDILLLDTISNLWPVRDENDNALVQEALMPLHSLPPKVSLGLVHHVRKSDGQEATAARGAGALSAFVDTILELRRYNGADRHDRKRVLTGYGRFDETPKEVVIELEDDGLGYKAHGDRNMLMMSDLKATLLTILPKGSPGHTMRQIAELWPGETSPKRQRMVQLLKDGVDHHEWYREGTGKKGDPFSYFLAAPREIEPAGPPPPDDSFPFPSLYSTGTGTESGGGQSL